MGPVAEYNSQLDPEAAQIVLDSGVEVVMVPLQVTHEVLVTPDVLVRIGQHTPFRRLIRSLLLFFAESYKTVFNFREGPPLHDPCAVCALLAPELFIFERCRIDVECRGVHSAGQTVRDVWRQGGKADNVTLATSIDVPAFWELMLAALSRADEQSPMQEDEGRVESAVPP